MENQTDGVEYTGQDEMTLRERLEYVIEQNERTGRTFRVVFWTLIIVSVIQLMFLWLLLSMVGGVMEAIGLLFRYP